MRALRLPIVLCGLLAMATGLDAQPVGEPRRAMRADDLFEIERIATIAWTPRRDRAAVEFRRRPAWLDATVPTTALRIVDVATGAITPLAAPSPEYVGYFGAAWSPDGRRLAFFSADTNGVIRPWTWTVGTRAPVLLRGLELGDALSDPPRALWSDDTRVILLVRRDGTAPVGPLYGRITRTGNGVDLWRRARAARTAAALVVDSRAPDAEATERRIVAVDVRTGAITEIARGAVHAPALVADRTVLRYRREEPALAHAPASSYFGPEAQGEEAYDRVNLGSAVHHVDLRTGATVATPPPEPARPAARPPTTTLRVDNDPAQGSRLVLVRPGRADAVIWTGNAWMKDIAFGRADPIAYRVDDATLTGWVLYPPAHVPGTPIPAMTMVYPGTLFSTNVPGTLSPFSSYFMHPQLFAALGYAVILPSMPEAERPLQGDAVAALERGVLPLLDTLVARGVIDPARVGVVGQSAGGWATLGLLARTTRFRTAIASASYSNLTSLYGTFYGQYRHGDAGAPLHGILLRMLQAERGYYGADATPWEEPARYVRNSPITHVAAMVTPLLLVHGEMDFIPIQQAEEMFTALYRLDRRVRLLRYGGEGHTIAARENVLDLWQRLEAWLKETMP